MSATDSRSLSASFPSTRANMARINECIALIAVAVTLSWPADAPGRQMLLHVITMAALAPCAVATVHWLWGLRWRTLPRHLWTATALQLACFLFWHSPFGMALGMHAAGGALLLQGSLFAAACLFWWCIGGLAADRVWHAIAALLVTGKLFCLVAVILTFAPRPLYHAMPLDDQQLAGLIMITLCPLTYVASALWLCRRWLMGFDTRAPVPR
jgi:putative membrane protein